ncbi:radical SAM protein [Candidatus Calescamantes bacterium]|nr:radical SAM protein [Candidatus Calescamantes bacterium]
MTRRLSQEELLRRKESLYALLSPCRLCPRECGVDRKKEKGYCGGSWKVKIASFSPHFGEEKELVGRGGSGTIFFSGCNLKCVFCQNYDISILEEGEEIEPEKLAQIMLVLKKLGCHNINLVTPTHFVPQIVDALIIAWEKGLDLPIVYNCGGYEKVETLKLLEGIIDIYMPDIKYGSSLPGQAYSHVPDYWEIVKKAVKEMHRQVGDLVVEKGIAKKGLLVRHLVMPNKVAESERVFKFLAEEISPHTYVNIMDQYRPLYHAHLFPEIARPITSEEYLDAINKAKSYGLYRGFPTESRRFLIF